jgi:MSHA pilin protein MshA
MEYDKLNTWMKGGVAMQVVNYKVNGFTLIELVIVIAIISILSAVAIPKFYNLSTAAQTNATAAVAGALSAANANNYAIRSFNATLGVSVANCTDMSNALQGGLPTGYTIVSADVAVNANVTCTLNGPSSSTATFTATGIA